MCSQCHGGTDLICSAEPPEVALVMAQAASLRVRNSATCRMAMRGGISPASITSWRERARQTDREKERDRERERDRQTEPGISHLEVMMAHRLFLLTFTNQCWAVCPTWAVGIWLCGRLANEVLRLNTTFLTSVLHKEMNE